MAIPKLSLLTSEQHGVGSFSIEDDANRKTSNSMEVDDFGNTAAIVPVSLMGMNVDLIQYFKSTMFFQTSHENDDSNEKFLESFANLKLKTYTKPQIQEKTS